MSEPRSAGSPAAFEAASMALPTAPELADLSLACQRLWSLDHNRLEPGRDYRLSLQVGMRVLCHLVLMRRAYPYH